jgi:hypothetical protein
MTLMLRNAGVICAGMLLSGCGITGQWSSRSLDPEIARDRFDFLAQPMTGTEFTRAHVSLHDDGRYSAEVYFGQWVQQSTGTWEKAGDRITFVDSKGFSQTYTYALSGDHRRLAVKRDIDGTEVTLTLERRS